MKIKKIVHVTLLSCSLLALAACSSTKHKNTDDMGMNGANDSAQSSGIGQGEDFGSTDGVSSQGLLSKRTYYFDFDRSNVHENDKPAIMANADYIIAHPNSKVIVEGHTDPRGSREYNVALGERRANAVADMLKSRGVNPNQIRVVSYGAEQLAQPGRTEADFQLDRRAVIVYLQK